MRHDFLTGRGYYPKIYFTNFVMFINTVSIMASENLKKNWEYVQKNYRSLLNTYWNKYVLVNNEKVVGSFDTYATAANEGIKNYGVHSGFLVEWVIEKPLNIVVSAKL